MGPSKTNIIIGAARLDCSARLIFISSIWMFGFHIHEYRTMISTISMMPDFLKTERVHTLLSWLNSRLDERHFKIHLCSGCSRSARTHQIDWTERFYEIWCESEWKVSDILITQPEMGCLCHKKNPSETDVAAWVISGRTVGWSPGGVKYRPAYAANKKEHFLDQKVRSISRYVNTCNVWSF